MSAPTRARVLEACACCGPDGAGKRNRGRRLCSGCYTRASRTGTLGLWPRATQIHGDLVARALEVRRRYGAPAWGSCTFSERAGRPPDSGMTWPMIARQLGVEPRALEKARERAGWPA